MRKVAYKGQVKSGTGESGYEINSDEEAGM